MKRIFTTLAIICALFGTVSAQNYTKVGNTYKAEKTQSNGAKTPLATPYEWEDTKGNKYPILMTESSGSCFIIKVSQKSGKEYRQYLGKEISAEICRAMGKEYKPTR